MKKLTQDVFKGAPDWVRSASVDSDGDACFYSVKTCDLKHDDDFWYFGFSDARKILESKCYYFDRGYDTTNWQQSAIDREEPARPREYIKDTI